MTFTPELLLRRLRQLQGDTLPARYLVGFSGGLDSTVLLHALAATRGDHHTPILAVHINHGLHPDAPRWERRCHMLATELDVQFVSRTISVAAGGTGIEAAAREARYAACLELMGAGDVLVSAHHRDDQAETLLLNLMRGSGFAGISGIGACRAFGPGSLVRPMLEVPRAAIEGYARRCHLQWITDPSNENLRFDRNFLRREILPRLRDRWPAVSARLGHSAELAGEAAELLDELARLDLAALAACDLPDAVPYRIDVAGLSRLSPSRQRNLLRYAIRACGLPQVPSRQLRQVQRELLPAARDRQPLVRWKGAEARRYRGRLYLLADTRPQPSKGAERRLLADGRSLPLGPGLGYLRLEAADGPGIDPAIVARGLELRFRRGGESLKPRGHCVTRSLKKLLQERGILPWLRDCVPLLYSGETLVAVADLWIAADHARDDGISVRWDGKPSLFHAE